MEPEFPIGHTKFLIRQAGVSWPFICLSNRDRDPSGPIILFRVGVIAFNRDA